MIQDSNDIRQAANAVSILKTAILQSQARAAKAVNQEQLALYYGIGRYISANTRNKFWGSGMMKMISQRLRQELPGLRGFSETNLKNMRSFYEAWNSIEVNSSVTTDEIDKTPVEKGINASKSIDNEQDVIRQLQLTNLVQFPLVPFLSISFTHHITILTNAKEWDERLFYIQYAADNKVNAEDLEVLIKKDIYHHQGDIPNNFLATIPDYKQAYKAIRMFKDEYLLDFINVEELGMHDEDIDERVIENSIIHNIKNFIMTFGKGFTYRGNQVHYEKFGVDSYVDLLFFNRELKSLVCIELKNGEFKPAYLGQLAAYLRILDDEEKLPDENPSIGIILCKKANRSFVEYVLQDYNRPLGVATYASSIEKLKSLLPPEEELKKLMDYQTEK